jgi:pyruvate dehydrogenase E2 component (dihydrolipoamide acetyltransferase)
VAADGDSTPTLSRGQQATVRRVAESRATVPDVTFTARVDVTALLGALPDGVAVADAALSACARALRAHPRANGAYRDARWERRERVNVGLALESEETIVVPVVPDADALELAEIAARRRELAERVRSGSLAARDMAGATFTFWAAGDERVESLVPVLVPPQAGALGVGGVRAVPVVREGAVVPGHEVVLTLVGDHRILYGAAATAFLGAIVAGLAVGPG